MVFCRRIFSFGVYCDVNVGPAGNPTADRAAATEALRREKQMTDLPDAMVRDLLECLWLPPYLPEDEQRKRIREAVRLLEGLRPRDELEGMLAVQMVATHFAAVQTLQHAVNPGLISSKRNDTLKQAEKLMSLFTRQVETLNRSRAKAAQKITLEHEGGEPRGQAVLDRKQPAATPNGGSIVHLADRGGERRKAPK